MNRRRERGFTLPELVFVGVAIAVMVAVTLLLAHPKNYAPSERNADRWIALSQTLLAVSQYKADSGTLPAGITGTQQIIGSEDGMLDLCPVLVPKYIKDLSYDPSTGQTSSSTICLEKGAAYSTGLTIAKSKDNIVTIAAPAAEGGETISVSKRF